jgi:NAD(P)H-dependent flavin oxidoreductase YrpB (nitropropane dioxygenase family)
MSTRFTQLVNVRYPIQLATMGGVGTVELAAAVAAAGGLGMVTTVTDLRRLAGGQRVSGVGIGFTVPFVEPAAIDAAAELATLVELFWADPATRLVERIHAGGALAGWQVGSADEAAAAEQAGADLVIVQGLEAGGHVRAIEPLRRTLPAARARVDVPIVAAGGIATRAHVVAALDLGADAVRVGTRFVASHESGAHPQYKAALVRASDDDSVLTDEFSVGWPSAPHRVLRDALEAARAHDPTSPVAVADRGGTQTALPVWTVTPPSAAMSGDIEAMALYAGRGVGAIHSVTPAADILAELAGLSSSARR